MKRNWSIINLSWKKILTLDEKRRIWNKQISQMLYSYAPGKERGNQIYKFFKRERKRTLSKII